MFFLLFSHNLFSKCFLNIWPNGFGCVCSDESLVEESRTFESRLQSLLHDTIQESESSMEVRHSCQLWLIAFSPQLIMCFNSPLKRETPPLVLDVE